MGVLRQGPSGSGTVAELRRKQLELQQAQQAQQQQQQQQVAAPPAVLQQQFSDLDRGVNTGLPFDPLQITQEGSERALTLAEQAQQAQGVGLQRLSDKRAFDERSQILGLRGIEKQRQAIGNIPVSEFNQEVNRRQRAQQQRRAFASGDISGASLLGAQQLRGGQQANIIQARLAELSPLISSQRGITSQLSQIDEAGRAQQANILGARGPQLSAARLAGLSPLLQQQQREADLAGQREILLARQRAGLAGQAAGFKEQRAGIESQLAQAATQRGEATSLGELGRLRSRGQIFGQVAGLAGQFLPRLANTQIGQKVRGLF